MGCILILHLESINEVNHYILKAKCAMQIRNFFLVFIVICLFEVAGCSNNIGNDEQTVEVQKRVGDDNYEDLKVVTDNNQVLQVKKILIYEPFLAWKDSGQIVCSYDTIISILKSIFSVIRFY